MAGRATREDIDPRFLQGRPDNYDEPKWQAFSDLPQFGGQDGRGMPRISPNGRGYDDLIWADSDGDNEFDFGEFFDYDQAMNPSPGEEPGESIFRGQKINEARDLDYREDMFGRDPVGRVREEPGTANQQLALNFQRYGEGEELPSGQGTNFMGQPALRAGPEDEGWFGDYVKRPFINYLAAPAAGTAGYLADLATGKADQRTDLTSNRMADALFSLPPLKAAASAVKGGFIGARQLGKQMGKSKELQKNVGKTYIGPGYTKAGGKVAPHRRAGMRHTIQQAPQTPFRKSVTNTLDKLGLPTKIPSAKEFFGRSSTPLGRHATGTTTFIGDALGKLGPKLSKWSTPLGVGAVGMAGAFEEGGLLPEDARTFLDARESPDPTMDDLGIPFGDKIRNVGGIDLNLDEGIPGLSDADWEALNQSRGRANLEGEEGELGDPGGQGTKGEKGDSSFNTIRDIMNQPYDPYVKPQDANTGPLDPDSQESRDARRIPKPIPRPAGAMENKDTEDTLKGIRDALGDVTTQYVDTNEPPPGTPQWPYKGWKGGNVDINGTTGNISSSPWATPPVQQRQPAPMLTEQEQFELDLNKANPRVQQLFSDGEDFKQLRDSGHPASRWEMSRPAFFKKSSSFNPGPSIRRVAAEQRRNRDLGIKAKRNREALEKLGMRNPYGPGIEEALGLKGPRGARGEPGPVGLEDAVNEAGAAERQAYFKTHNLEEPTDPEEKTRFSQWYNTHGKRNDQNDRWSDSEPYPKFDPFLS